MHFLLSEYVQIIVAVDLLSIKEYWHPTNLPGGKFISASHGIDMLAPVVLFTFIVF